MSKKHWLENLESYGRPLEMKAEEIKSLYAKIADKLKEVQYYEAQIRECEADAERLASEHWSKDEISTAKVKSDDLHPNRMNRDDFMAYFRSDDYCEQLNSDDCIEVFRTAMKGGSDFTVQLLQEILSDYEASHIAVYYNEIVFMDSYHVVRDAETQSVNIFSTKLPENLAKDLGRTHMNEKVIYNVVGFYNKYSFEELDTYLLNEVKISQEEREIIVEALSLYEQE